MVKQGSVGWHGVAACQNHLRTCDLEIPRGHATVKCGMSVTKSYRHHTNGLGKYFEVRYFLNVIVCSAHTLACTYILLIKLTCPRKLVTIQLPIVLIHMVRLTTGSCLFHSQLTLAAELS